MPRRPRAGPTYPRPPAAPWKGFPPPRATAYSTRGSMLPAPPARALALVVRMEMVVSPREELLGSRRPWGGRGRDLARRVSLLLSGRRSMMLLLPPLPPLLLPLPRVTLVLSARLRVEGLLLLRLLLLLGRRRRDVLHDRTRLEEGESRPRGRRLWAGTGVSCRKPWSLRKNR